MMQKRILKKPYNNGLNEATERKSMKVNLNNIEIDKRSELSAYVTIGNWVVYLDNSTGENIIDTWEKDEEK